MVQLRASLKVFLSKSPLMQRMSWQAARQLKKQGAGYFRWSKIIEDAGRNLSRGTSSTQKKILVATSVGAHQPAMAGEGMLGAALSLRGADVHFLLCDEILPACLDCELRWTPGLTYFARNGPRKTNCPTCFPPGLSNYAQLGLPVHRYSEGLGARARQEAESLIEGLPQKEWESLVIDDVSVGNHAKAGVLRFLARGTLTGSAQELAIFRRYLVAGILTLRTVQALIRNEDFDAVVLHHGIYIPQGVIAEVFRNAGLDVTTWNIGYRKNCLLFSHNETYHHTMMNEPVSSWESMRWSPEHEKKIDDYLKSRWFGTNDWIWFHDKPVFDISAFSARTGFDLSKPTVGLLTNVFWDAQLHYPTNIFANMLEWVFDTITYFIGRPELQLLVRVHPAEIRGTVPARERVADAIAARFGKLPPNILIVGPEDQISTYPLMASCDTVIIYGTKTGIELTSMGIPTIVGGEAWIKNKGITIDPSTREAYFAELNKLPRRLRIPAEIQERARRYAFHFFFRRMIPIEYLRPGKGVSPIELEIPSLDALAPGESRGLDVICDGILLGTPFIYPEEDLIEVVDEL